MSTIVTDTLQGKTSATSITLPTTTNIGSTPLVSASANSMTIRGEGSAVTNIQQGLCKHWVQLDNKDEFTTKDSFNQSSATDNGTGDMTFTLSNNMNSASYSGTGASGAPAGGTTVEHTLVDGYSSSVYTLKFVDSSFKDANFNAASAHGDLA